MIDSRKSQSQILFLFKSLSSDLEKLDRIALLDGSPESSNTHVEKREEGVSERSNNMTNLTCFQKPCKYTKA